MLGGVYRVDRTWFSGLGFGSGFKDHLGLRIVGSAPVTICKLF